MTLEKFKTAVASCYSDRFFEKTLRSLSDEIRIYDKGFANIYLTEAGDLELFITGTREARYFNTKFAICQIELPLFITCEQLRYSISEGIKTSYRVIV